MLKKLSHADTAVQVKELRESARLTQERFALTIGVAKATVQNWESGRTRVQRRTLAGIRAMLALGGTPTRYTEETKQALREALDIILDRATSTVVEKVSELLTHYAGQYGGPADRPPAGAQKKGARP